MMRLPEGGSGLAVSFAARCGNSGTTADRTRDLQSSGRCGQCEGPTFDPRSTHREEDERIDQKNEHDQDREPDASQQRARIVLILEVQCTLAALGADGKSLHDEVEAECGLGKVEEKVQPQQLLGWAAGAQRGREGAQEAQAVLDGAQALAGYRNQQTALLNARRLACAPQACPGFEHTGVDHMRGWRR